MLQLGRVGSGEPRPEVQRGGAAETEGTRQRASVSTAGWWSRRVGQTARRREGQPVGRGSLAEGPAGERAASMHQ